MVEVFLQALGIGNDDLSTAQLFVQHGDDPSIV